MLPEAGAFELVFLAMVALIVVGPKDLPVLLRKLGQFTAKMRGLASDFRSSFDEMARQSELDELRREVEALRDGKFAESTSAMEGHLHEIHAGLSFDALGGPDRSAVSPPAPAAPAPAPADVAEPELPLLEPPLAEPAPHAPPQLSASAEPVRAPAESAR